MKAKRVTGVFAFLGILCFAFLPSIGIAKDKKGDMALIPPGEYTMGADHQGDQGKCEEYSGACKGSWYTQESPAHTVYIDAFFIDKHEVTQERFSKVMGSNPSVSQGKKRPVDSVTWEEAGSYCKKAGKRLPTEAEWEYAARAGTTGAYYWGDKPGQGHANCVECGSQWDGKETAPVGSFPPNPWGIYDMAGNVWEWVQDWFEDDYYQKSLRKNPKGPEKSGMKVIRGGSLYETTYYTRTAFRQSFHPAVRSDGIGFRCVSNASAADVKTAKLAPVTAAPPAPRNAKLFEALSSEENQPSMKPSAPVSVVPPVAPPMGDLLVSVDVTSATVQVNGIHVGIARTTAPLELRKLAVGKARIRVETKGYDAQDRHVVIRAGDMMRELFAFKAKPVEREARIIDDSSESESEKVSPVSETARSAFQPAIGAASAAKDMALIPGGVFKAGADPEKLFAECQKQFADCERKRTAFEWSGPAHDVQLDAFYVDRYEATQADFERVMGKNPSKVIGPNLPAEMVTWEEAREYCGKVGKRLPTEMEWEMAVRGGADTAYYWGDEMEDGYSWYNKNSGLKSHPVGQKKSNAFGLYDMAGNVWEWVGDWFDENYYKNSPRSNPTGPASGKTRGLRGGSYGTSGADNRSIARRAAEPQARFNDVGLRCAMSAKTPGR